MGRVYAVALAANFLGDFLSEVGQVVFRMLADVDLSGRIDVLALIVLVLGTWIVLSPRLLKLSNYLNPHAKYWNSVVSKFIYAISFLLAYLVKAYISSLVSEAQNMAVFSTPTKIVLVFVSFLSIVAFTIYFEEFHNISVLGGHTASSDEHADRKSD